MSDIFLNQTLRVELEVLDELNAIVPLAGATSLDMTFRKPISGDTFSRPAALVTDGSDGKIEYKTAVGELDEVGVWHVQGLVVDGVGEDNPATIKNFYVKARNA